MPGLPKLKGTSVAEDERTAARVMFETIDKVEEELQRLGIAIDEEKPKFPIQKVTAKMLLTDNNEEYTNMYSQQLAWLNYIGPHLARTKAICLELKNALKDISARVRIALKEKNKSFTDKQDRFTEADIDDAITVDPLYKELIIESQKYEQLKLMFDEHASIVERNLRVVSRQIEMRKLEMGGEGIANHMPRRGQPSRFPYTPVSRT